jgi:hypothetical protein
MNLSNRGPLGPRKGNLVSKKLRDSAKGQDCTLRLSCCNHDPEATVLCHIRAFGWAGISEKPDDFLSLYACSACHDAFDRRGLAEWGWDDVLRAHGETLRIMFRKGLLVVK